MFKKCGMLLFLLMVLVFLSACSANDKAIINNVGNTTDQLKDLFDEKNKDVKEESPQDDRFLKVKVSRVVDGDTFIFDDNGKEERVRLIGVDTPESVGDYKDNPQVFGAEASYFTKKALLDKEIYLSFDVGKRDKYDRLLAYAWLEVPEDEFNEAEVRGKMFNSILLSEGYARLMSIPPNVQYVDILKDLQVEARDSKKGLWSDDLDCGCTDKTNLSVDKLSELGDSVKKEITKEVESAIKDMKFPLTFK